MKDERLHQVFRLGIIIKGLDGVLEAVAGALLALFSGASITRVATWLFRKELSEDPGDFVATHLVAAAQHLSVDARLVAAAYLFLHGVLKLAIVAALWREHRASFRVAAAVLTLIVGAQWLRVATAFSWLLAALTILDTLILAAVWREYLQLHGPVQ